MNREPMHNDTTQPQPQHAERSTHDEPWCWQGKGTLRMIGEAFDVTSNTASARSVYLALSEIASDDNGENFTRRIGDIAARAGVSYPTAARILKRFEALNVIRVQRNLIDGTRELAPSTYTLLNRRLENDDLRLGNGRNFRPLPRVQKNSTRILEESEKETRSATHAVACSVSPNGFEGLSADNRQIADGYNQTLVVKGWRRLDKSTAAVLEALEYLAGVDWRRLFDDVASDPPAKWPKPRTLVRLRWHHY